MDACIVVLVVNTDKELFITSTVIGSATWRKSQKCRTCNAAPHFASLNNPDGPDSSSRATQQLFCAGSGAKVEVDPSFQDSKRKRERGPKAFRMPRLCISFFGDPLHRSIKAL
jgi:hypothetical protein